MRAVCPAISLLSRNEYIRSDHRISSKTVHDTDIIKTPSDIRLSFEWFRFARTSPLLNILLLSFDRDRLAEAGKCYVDNVHTEARDTQQYDSKRPGRCLSTKVLFKLCC